MDGLSEKISSIADYAHATLSSADNMHSTVNNGWGEVHLGRAESSMRSLKWMSNEGASQVAQLTAENAKLREQLAEAVAALNDVLPYVPPFLNFGQNEDGRRRYGAIMRKAEDVVRNHDKPTA
jgi:hypothetical protein